jgi:nucleoside-diphosphate-sugar epimerase
MLEGKKVLITGATGRIGAAVATRFAPVCEMWALARYSREGSWEEALKMGVKPLRGDFGSGSLAEVPTDFDYVLHIAANVYVKTAEQGMADNSDGVARLMKHCKSAKAFMHVSATGVYKPDPDPYHRYPEDSDIGSSSIVHGSAKKREGASGQYVPTKLAGEGAARAGCLILDLPTVICRQNYQYGGPHVQPGMIDRWLDRLVTTGEVQAPEGRVLVMSPIHEDDICDVIEPSLSIASVPASIVNWCGDEAVEWHELFEYAGQLIGKAPKFVVTSDFHSPACVADPTKRRAMAGPAKVNWKEGVRRTLKLRHPGIELREAS